MRTLPRGWFPIDQLASISILRKQARGSPVPGLNPLQRLLRVTVGSGFFKMRLVGAMSGWLPLWVSLSAHRPVPRPAGGHPWI